jgi:hypothetical protein
MIVRYWAAIGKIWTLLNLTIPMACSAGIWELASITNLFFVGRLNGAKYIGTIILLCWRHSLCCISDMCVRMKGFELVSTT